MDEEIRVTHGGLRLDRWLASRMPGYSRAHLQNLIKRGCVRVDGAVRPVDFRLQGDETVVLRRPEPVWPKQPFEEWILFEDGSCLVFSKPPGLLIHPVGESWLAKPQAALDEAEPNLAGLLYRHRPRIAASGASRCGLVHRLDRETSGVLIVAKTPAAQENLLSAFAQRRVEKVYRAIVRGEMDCLVKVDAPVGRPTGRRKVQVTPFGRPSSTDFTALESGRGATLVEARPKTGRTHQIRVHLAHIHHPVLGDPEWDARPLSGTHPPPRLMLHAWRLTLPHPKTGKEITFTAPLPKDFRNYWKLLRK